MSCPLSSEEVRSGEGSPGLLPVLTPSPEGLWEDVLGLSHHQWTITPHPHILAGHCIHVPLFSAAREAGCQGPSSPQCFSPPALREGERLLSTPSHHPLLGMGRHCLRDSRLWSPHRVLFHK